MWLLLDSSAEKFKIGGCGTSGFSCIVEKSFSYPFVVLVAVVVYIFVFPYEVEYCPFKVCKELYSGFNVGYIESVDRFWYGHLYYINPTGP